MLDLSFLQDLNVANRGALKDRGFYRTYSSFADAQSGANENIQSLDGEWNFCYFDKIGDAISFPDVNFDKKIHVPHSAQIDGYDKPIYCGGGYIMPYYPPYVPYENPAFCYSKKVLIKTDKRVIISFGGVDSCLYLYVNGKFVGFARVSHAQNEFDITDFIFCGENKIDVLVAKFNAGSYLEDQDKWRLSGIFRSVKLIFRPKKYLYDYTVKTDIYKADKAVNGKAHFVFDNPLNVPVEVVFADKIYKAENNSVTVEIENIKLWSAEAPNLYDFIICAGEEFIPEKIGFRTIAIENGIMHVNGAIVKLRGVNRHEFHPEKGAAISVEDTLNDLIVLKKLNVNSIRTSHYPDMPEFYEMCDKYGFYIIDEADLECHGAAHQNGVNTYEEKLFSDLAENPAWESEFLYRIKKLYSRDKNRCSVIMWSLGNESGYGINFEKCAEWLKAQRDGRPIHYEGVFHRPNEDIYYTKNLDVMSRMYPELKWMTDDYLNDPREKRPLVLCEYSHAMGNSNGDVKDYWDIIESNDRFIGAFVWEFADHGISDKKGNLLYGGDFGEKKHTGKFCMDGLLTAYRQVKSGAKETAHIYSPVQIEKTGENEYAVFNKNYFVSLAAVSVKYSLIRDGKTLYNGELNVSDIFPREKRKFRIQFDKLNGNFVTILFKAEHAGNHDLFIKGYEFYQKAFVLRDIKQTQTPVAAEDYSVTDVGDLITVVTGKQKYVFEKSTGKLLRLCPDGEKNLLLSPLKINVARARLDNDCSIYSNWESAGIFNNGMYTVNYECKKDKNGAIALLFNGSLVTESTKPHIKYTLVYRIFNKKISIEIHSEISDFVKYLPRFGITFALEKSFGRVEYLGFNEESYVDKHNYCYKNISSFSVGKDFSNYLVPQECGSRFDTDWVKIKNTTGDIISLSSDKSFSFSALPYDTMTLNDAKHSWQLKKSKGTFICADYFMSGVGSNSCGPELDERYRLKEKSFDFNLVLGFNDNGRKN